MATTNDKDKTAWKKIINKKVIIMAFCLAVIVGVGTAVYMVKASEKPSFCTSCHIMQPYYDSYHDSNLLANKHAEAELVCHDCHESSISIQAEEGFKFITGDYTIPLEKREFSREFCLDCHDDFEAIQSKTNFDASNPHDSHNGEQDCNLCHSMHQESQVMCSECHVFGWFDELGDNWQTESM